MRREVVVLLARLENWRWDVAVCSTSSELTNIGTVSEGQILGRTSRCGAPVVGIWGRAPTFINCRMLSSLGTFPFSFSRLL